MKFEEIDDDTPNEYFNQYSIELPNGRKFSLAFWQVLYGYRVVGYFHDDFGPCINWCCGNNIPLLVATHHSIKTMIEQGCPINAFRPFSRIKPWPLDNEFVEYFKTLANQYEVSAPDVSSPGNSTNH